MKKITILLMALTLASFLFASCQKAKEPAKEAQPQQNKEQQPSQQPKTKSEAISKQQLSPLERARGREVKDENGLIITWGSLKYLPTLDEVFSVLETIPAEIEFPKEVQQIELPDTAERRKLKKNIKDEIYDYLYAVESPNRKCIVEFYCGTLPRDKQECWLRGIDRSTQKVLWKYNEPGLIENPSPQLEFSMESDNFILSNITKKKPGPQNPGWAVKLFSCQNGFRQEIYATDEAVVTSPLGTITPDGKNILVSTHDGKIINYDLEGSVLWDKQVNPHHKDLHPIYISLDGLELATFYRSPVIRSLSERRRAGLPEELQLLQIKTGDIKLKKRFYADLGDKSMITNTMEIRGIIPDKEIIGLWLMDGIGFVLDKTNPFGNVAVLITKENVYAFRIHSLGFSFTNDGRYLSANHKMYDLQSFIDREKVEN